MKTKLFALSAFFVCLFMFGTFTQVEARHHNRVCLNSFSLSFGCSSYRPAPVYREYVYAPAPVVIRQYRPAPRVVAYPAPGYYQEVYVAPCPPPVYYYPY